MSIKLRIIQRGGVQRGIKSRHVPVEGEGPNLGRVTRMRDAQAANGGAATPDGTPPGEEFRSGVSARKPVVVAWSVLLFLTTLVVIGGFMVFWLRGHVSLTPTVAETNADEQVRVVSRFASPGEETALELVKRALSTRDVTQVESLFRLGQTTPAEALDFIARAEERDGRLERYAWLSSMDLQDMLVDGVLVVYAGKDGPAERLAFLTPDDTGVWKLDFEGFARTSRPAWKDLLAGRAEHAQVRVFVAKDAYFNGPFAAESQWVCFGMVSSESNALLAEGQKLLHGYCRQGSPQAKALAQLFAADEATHRVTLEIARSAGPDARQFEITRVWSEDWVLAPKAFDETFK